VLLLSQSIRRAGRIPVPVPEPAVSTAATLLRSARLLDFSPEQARLLNFGRVLDTGKLRTEFGFAPGWTTAEAFDDYVRGRALCPTICPERVAAVERGVLDLAARLR
jgi:UDP-glucose 4-epimerase